MTQPLTHRAVIIATSTILALGGGAAFATSALASTPTHSSTAATPKQKCSTKPANDPCHLKKHKKHKKTATPAVAPAVTPAANK